MNPSFEQLGIWVACALLFVDVYLRWDTNRTARAAAEEKSKREGRPTEISPQPFVVKPVDDFATRKELFDTKVELTNRIDGVNEDLQKEKDRIVRTGEERKKSIEGKVENLRLETKKDIEGVSHEIKEATRDVAKLDGKVDQINLNLIGLTSAVQNLQNNQGKE